ncbi:Lrp/AsnC family transcriptional regulator [Henriciella pelagia]|jgi:Lrp/AsnC family leucine-responsive transcriptional regulator|uniref:Lrp/AsnC family transcriptional regulator n=1 Tax=Henriciella pelagia TaxID=1977912 RepID=UPI003513D39C
MLSKPLDATDKRILTVLQREARLSNVDLAKRVGLSPSPCLARVRALEEADVIGRYVALVNPETVGLGVNVFIRVTLERQVEKALERFESRMHAYPEVMECYLMTGDSDYLIRILVRDNSEVERFIVQNLSTIEGVANINSSFALKQVKYKTEMEAP